MYAKASTSTNMLVWHNGWILQDIGRNPIFAVSFPISISGYVRPACAKIVSGGLLRHKTLPRRRKTTVVKKIERSWIALNTV